MTVTYFTFEDFDGAWHGVVRHRRSPGSDSLAYLDPTGRWIVNSDLITRLGGADVVRISEDEARILAAPRPLS